MSKGSDCNLLIIIILLCVSAFAPILAGILFLVFAKVGILR